MTGFRREDFEPHIATVFEVAPVGMDRVQVELVEVKEVASAALDGFSLLFRGGTETVFRHDSHRVQHPALGEMELFLGPVHIGKTDATYYQAIFSTPKW